MVVFYSMSRNKQGLIKKLFYIYLCFAFFASNQSLKVAIYFEALAVHASIKMTLEFDYCYNLTCCNCIIIPQCSIITALYMHENI